MAIKYQHIALKQLDRVLADYALLKDMRPPQKGWLRAIRNVLGMSGRQLGQRLGVSKMRVADMERAEVKDAMTLKSLRRAAEALDCVLVYALVPNTSLEDTLHKQAQKKARQDMERASHTMALEDQDLSAEAIEKATDSVADHLMDKMPRTLWD